MTPVLTLQLLVKENLMPVSAITITFFNTMVTVRAVLRKRQILLDNNNDDDELMQI